MRDLRTDTELLVPADLVGLPVNFDGIVFRHPWAASSNGLASGNHLLEALCAACTRSSSATLSACWLVAAAQGSPSLLLDPSTIRGEVVADLVGRLDERGLEVNLFWCPTDIGVPTFTCFVVDRRPGAGAYRGYGCHLDPEIAMVRAVTEAVQARTIFIAGARDDLMRSDVRRAQAHPLTREDFEQQSVVVAWDDVPDRDTGTFHGDIRVMLDALAAAGLRARPGPRAGRQGVRGRGGEGDRPGARALPVQLERVRRPGAPLRRVGVPAVTHSMVEEGRQVGRGAVG